MGAARPITGPKAQAYLGGCPGPHICNSRPAETFCELMASCQKSDSSNICTYMRLAVGVPSFHRDRRILSCARLVVKHVKAAFERVLSCCSGEQMPRCRQKLFGRAAHSQKKATAVDCPFHVPGPQVHACAGLGIKCSFV